MSQSASQASKFYEEVVIKQIVWTVKDEIGFPTVKTTDGSSAQPFWSSESRVKKIIKEVPDYRSFNPFKIEIKDFIDKWLPGLEKDGILIGVNWSGKNVVGYDLDSKSLKANIDYFINKLKM